LRTRLGFADVTIANNKSEARSAITNEILPMTENQALPIKFRIESGALGACQRNGDCTEVSVTQEGGTFFTTTNFAAVVLEKDWVSDEILALGNGSITLTVERVPLEEGQSCHSGEGVTGKLHTELQGCYRYTTDPDLRDPRVPEHLRGFQTANNKVAQCTKESPVEDPNADYMLFKSDPGERIKALRDAPAPPGLNCDDFAFMDGLPSNPVLRFASLKWHAVSRAVGRAVGVKTAYAWDGGIGGQLGLFDGFSHISRGIGLRGSKASLDPAPTPVGLRVEPDPKVRLLNEHVHSASETEEHDHEPAVGIRVTFRVLTGTGNFGDGTYGTSPTPVTTVVKYTDENGEASAPWYLGVGANVIIAEAATITDPITFSATGLEAVGSISGLVTDRDGSALDNAPVRLVGITNPGLNRSTITDDGEYTFANMPDGRYTVTVEATGFTTAAREVVLDGEGRHQTVNFTLTPTGGIAGVVTNAVTGAAIAGATVRIVGTETGGVTNADGRFVFANLRAGPYQVRATMVNFVARTVDVTVGADQAPVTIALQPTPADLAVTSFTFSPAEPTTDDRVTYNIIVTNLGGTTSEAGLATLIQSRDGEVGHLNPNLVLPAVGPGFTVGYTLLAADLGAGSRSTTFTVNTGTPPVPDANAGNNTATVTFTVAPVATPTGTVVGQVTDAATGLPLSSAAISVVGVTGQVFTNVAGNYSLQAPQGLRTLRAARLGYASAQATVTVTDGQVTVNFALQPAPDLPGGGGCTVNCPTTPP
jgi:hypothetical protein